MHVGDVELTVVSVDQKTVFSVSYVYWTVHHLDR